MREDMTFLKGKSQPYKVWWWLQEHGRITNLQCHEIFGIRHCPSVIKQIRKKIQNTDWEIVNEKKKGVNRFGEQTWWDDYVLTKKAEQ